MGDERSRQEKQGIKRKAHADIKPENRIVIAVFGLFEVVKGCFEATVLQFVGHKRKHTNHGNHAIIGGVEQSAQRNTHGHADELHQQIVYCAPK